MNLIALVGELVDKPVLRESSMGNRYAIMNIKVTRPFAGVDGRYESDIFNVSIWRGIAESIVENGKPGDQIAMKGRLQSRVYEGSDGVERRSYDLIAEYVTIMTQH
jgi:single-strand DNA-binding protein